LSVFQVQIIILLARDTINVEKKDQKGNRIKNLDLDQITYGNLAYKKWHINQWGEKWASQ